MKRCILALALAGAGCDTDSEERPPVSLTCEGAQPIPQAFGAPSEAQTCEDDVVVRDGKEDRCTPPPPSNETCDVGPDDECKSTAECLDGPQPHCGRSGNLGEERCVCSYGCERDEDCPDGSICDCRGRPQCVPAECSSSADCISEPGTQALCRLAETSGELQGDEYRPDECGPQQFEWVCFDLASECRVDEDCGDVLECSDPSQPEEVPVCRYDSEEGRFRCATTPCGSGCG